MSNRLIEQLVNDFYKTNKNQLINKQSIESNDHNQKVKSLVERFYQMFEDDIIEQDVNQENLNDDVTADEDESFLDKVIAGKDVSVGNIVRSNVPSIYAFITSRVPNMIKVGYTDQGVETRLKQWKHHYQDADLIGCWPATEFNIAKERVYFKDYPVHKRIEKAQYPKITNDEKEAFKMLEANKDLVDMHVSSEFFHKYKDMDTEHKEALSKQILEDIITELKRNIRENDNLTDVILYKLVDEDNGTNKADIHWSSNHPNFKPTGLQEECIQNGVQAIKEGKTDLLMSAVMRFGKVFSSYSIVYRSDMLNYVLVTSAKADVREAWRDEINHEDFYRNFVFIEFISKPDVVRMSSFEPSKGVITTKDDVKLYDDTGCHIIERELKLGHKVIVFATLQDLSGALNESEDFDFNAVLNEAKDSNRTIKEQHKYLFEHHPDIIIVDETHYGSHSQVFGAAIGLSKKDKDEYTKDEISAAKKEMEDAEKYDNVITAMHAKYRMQCSGTPYYILQSGEFAKTLENKTIITKVSFTDMLNARNEWSEEHVDEDQSNSPYYGVPNIIKYGMQLTKKCQQELAGNDTTTNLTELFRLDANREFVHKDAIIELMTSIFGNSDNKPGFMKLPEVVKGEIFKHTIMVLPRIDACTALRNLLVDNRIIDENNRKIIVLVEKRTKTVEGGRQADMKTVKELNNELDRLEKEGKHSLMLTVNRFMTGVSIPLADSMFYMKSTKSPQEYDQTVFRLTTRNIKKYIDENGEEKKINLKPNVYLVDFDINRMYQMTVKSAIQQCEAKGLYDPDDIKDAVAEQLDTIPMFIDTKEHVYDKKAGDVMKGLHTISTDDLMLKYINYNAEKDIQSSIQDMMDDRAFDGFLNDVGNLEIIRNFDKGSVMRSGLDQGGDGGDTIDTSEFEGSGKGDNKDKGDGDNDREISQESVDLKELKERFIGMLKNILYCNICLDKPVDNITKFVKSIQKPENKELAECFKIDTTGFDMVLKALSAGEKGRINMLLLFVYKQINDPGLKPVDRALNAIKKMGRLDDKKSEDNDLALVVTPEKLVKKMVDKINPYTLRDTESILEVNSKTGEFVVEIYKRYGKTIANKVKIVPGDRRCKAFIKKILNLLQLNEYNIIDIEDLNGDGKYNIKDFLDIKNEDLIKMSGGKKFGAILSNAPYANGLHEKFEAKYFDICDGEICWVAPASFLLGKKQNKRITDNFDKYGADIETINGNEYFDATIAGTMAIVYSNTARKSGYIKFDGKKYEKSENISMTSNDELLEKFKSIISPLALKDNVLTHICDRSGDKHFTKFYKATEDNNAYCLRFVPFAGSGSSGNTKLNYYQLINNKTIIKGYYKDLINNDKFKLYIVFDNDYTLMNFVNYTNTLFCMACLYLKKYTLNLYADETSLIPWFDFSNPIFSKAPNEIDDYLFKKYNISNEIRYHIQKLLPQN